MNVLHSSNCPSHHRRAALPHDWIIEVLDDLRAYAKENRLDALAKEIEDTRLVAQTEIASKPGLPEGAADGPVQPIALALHYDSR